MVGGEKVPVVHQMPAGRDGSNSVTRIFSSSAFMSGFPSATTLSKGDGNK